MKKLLLIFIFAIGIATDTFANKDTMLIYSNRVDLLMNGASAITIALNGITYDINGNPGAFTVNIGDTLVFWNQASSFAGTFKVNTTIYPSISPGGYFPTSGYVVTTADMPSFPIIFCNSCMSLPVPDYTFITITVNNPATGINEKTKTNNLTLFPNPTKNIFSIASLKTANISVYNQLGSLVKQQAFENETIALNMADLAQGIYMVEVWADGKRSLSKLVKE